MLKWFALLFGGMSLCGTIFAEADEDSTSVTPDTVSIAPKYILKEIVVTASRIPEENFVLPASVTTITKEEMEGYTDVADVLEKAVGTTVRRTGFWGSIKTLSLRGSSYQQTLFLLDGRPLNDPQNGGIDLNFIPLSIVDKLEIVRGASSSLYGADAVGGVVNILTKSFYRSKPYTKLVLRRGSFNTSLLALEFGRGIGEDFDFYITADSKETDGPRANSDYDGETFFGKARYRIGDSEVSVQSKRYRSKMGYPGSLYWPAPSARGEDYRLDSDFSIERGGVRLKTYNSQIWNIFDGASHNNTLWGGEGIASNSVGSHFFTYGVSGEKNWLESTSAKKHTCYRYGLFAEDRWTIESRLNLHLACRWDAHSVYGQQISPLLGVSCFPADRVSLFGSVKKAFRAPTLNDLYYEDSWSHGDRDLTPERAIAYEVGIKNRTGSLQLTFFLSNVEDMILWGDPDGDWVYTPYNIDSRTAGIETSLSFPVTSWANLSVNYCYISSLNKATGKELDYRPTRTGTIVGEMRKKLLQDKIGVSLKFDGKYVGRRYTDLGNTERLPDYGLVDVLLRVRIIDISIAYRVENLADTEYQFIKGYPVPGRNHSFGLEWELWD